MHGTLCFHLCVGYEMKYICSCPECNTKVTTMEKWCQNFEIFMKTDMPESAHSITGRALNIGKFTF